MRIGIDARMYGGEQTGIGNYIRNLLENLLKIDCVNQYVLFLLEPEYSRLKTTNPRVTKAKVNARWYTWQEQIFLPRTLQKFQLDLVHFPHFNAPLLYRGKYLLTVHDITQNYYPGNGFKAHLRRVIYRYVFTHNIRHAVKTISVSHFTKKDILNNFPAAPQKIKVIHEGIDPVFRSIGDRNQTAALRQKYKITKPFLLYVGVLRDHKNVVGLVKAFAILRKKFGLDLQLVITGKKNPRYPELYTAIKNLSLQNDIIFAGFVPKEDLVLLYNGAAVLVLPSFREGFGFTPLEAMACGTPVAASQTTSIPEVVGDAALLFNPYNPRDMARQIARLFQDPKLAENLRGKGFQRIKIFSWLACATHTLALYNEIYNQNRK